MEITRTELPVKAGHRGRKPCEWRADGFLIPKGLICINCNGSKATTKEAFIAAVTKKGITPKEYVETYQCRSCRPKADKSPAKSESKTKVARQPKPPETVMVGKHELTRVELPVDENHRGRMPCEWYIGDFLIPKELICCECNRPVITNKDAFVKLIDKSNLKAERLVKKYICRSCRSSMRANDEAVKIGRMDESKPKEESKPLFETRQRGSSGMEFGFIVKRKPIVFHTLRADFEQNSFLVTGCATEIYDLTGNTCIKHPKEKEVEITERMKRDGIAKFRDIKTAFNLKDIEAVLKHMVNGGLKYD
jgi:hypothetical protein